MVGVLEVRGGSDFDFSAHEERVLKEVAGMGADALRKAAGYDGSVVLFDNLMSMVHHTTTAAHHRNLFEDVVDICFSCGKVYISLHLPTSPYASLHLP